MPTKTKMIFGNYRERDEEPKIILKIFKFSESQTSLAHKSFMKFIKALKLVDPSNEILKHITNYRLVS